MLSHEVTTEKSNPAIDVEKSASTSSVGGEVVEGNSEELGAGSLSGPLWPIVVLRFEEHCL
jgi:hypothetical protein